MPQITALSVQTKNKKRCNIFIDGEFYSGISLETVVKNRLKIGQEIDVCSLSEIILESDKVEALSLATDYISCRLKTKRQVKDYLLKKGYSEEVVWQTIDKLKEYNYINDEEYSSRYIECQSKNQGRLLTEFKLMAKGVRKEDIANAFDVTIVDSKENAKHLAIKYLRGKQITKETIAKTYKYLLSRGFSYDDSSYAVSTFGDDD